MTRRSLFQLLAGAPLAAFCGSGMPAAADGELRVQLGPGRYTIAPGGGISVFANGVRIEGCTFQGCAVGIASPAEPDAASSPIA